MITDLVRQQGFLAAHGVWCVSEIDAPLVPYVGVVRESGEQELVRFVDEEDYAHAVEKARAFLLAGSPGATRATLVFDGFVTLPDGKTDALVVEGRVYGEPPMVVTYVVPYRSCRHPDGFAVYRPKLVAVEGTGEPDHDAMGNAFFEGVDSHEQGAKVWERFIDQSR